MARKRPSSISKRPRTKWRRMGRGCGVDIMFHAQQAAEKSMKAFLAWNDVPFRKTHNLEELGQQCVLVDPMLAPVADQAVPLTEYAWKFRYPGEAADPDRADAEAALAAARNVHDAILARLPKGARP